MKIIGLSLVWILLFGTLVAQTGMLPASAMEPNSFSPRNLNATVVSNTQISLIWDPPINATGVSGYQIEYKTNSDSYSILSLTGNLTTYLNTGLLENTTYTYRVSAITSDGISNPSNESTVTIPIQTHIPNSPTGLVITTGSGTTLNLTWGVPSDNGGSPITSYLIQRNGTTIVTDTFSNKTSFIDTNLLPSHEQTYQVAAWNSAGLGTFSNSVSGMTGLLIISPPSNNVTNYNSTNLGQMLSDLEHKRNQLLQQQRQETLTMIHDCRIQFNTALENKTQIIQDCKIKMRDLNQKYKDLTNQLKVQLAQLKIEFKSRVFATKEKHSKQESHNLVNMTKYSKQELSNSVNITKQFKKNSENRNNYLENMTKYSDKKLYNFQNIMNHFKQKSEKQDQNKHNGSNGQQSNHENDD